MAEILIGSQLLQERTEEVLVRRQESELLNEFINRNFSNLMFEVKQILHLYFAI